jgi:hypothetical protein
MDRLHPALLRGSHGAQRFPAAGPVQLVRDARDYHVVTPNELLKQIFL